MGLDISILEPRKVKYSQLEALEYNYITFITQNKIKTRDAEVLKCFEALFFEKEIEYYDPVKGLEKLGYIRDDVCFEGCGRYIRDRHLQLISQEDFICKLPGRYKATFSYDIRVKEYRRYQFWWDYVTTMRTRKKRLNGKLEVINPPTFTVTEICLYHPQISYQRNGMKEQFYEDGMWESDDVTSIATVKEHIDRYAEDKDESYRLLYEPFVEGKTFLRYW